MTNADSNGDVHIRNHMARIKILETALLEIMKGEGAFSRDPLEHASNCIDSMKATAREALNAIPTAAIATRKCEKCSRRPMEADATCGADDCPLGLRKEKPRG